MHMFARVYEIMFGNILFREKSENRVIYVMNKRNYHQNGSLWMDSRKFSFPFLTLLCLRLIKNQLRRHLATWKGCDIITNLSQPSDFVPILLLRRRVAFLNNRYY